MLQSKYKIRWQEDIKENQKGWVGGLCSGSELIEYSNNFTFLVEVAFCSGKYLFIYCWKGNYWNQILPLCSYNFFTMFICFCTINLWIFQVLYQGFPMLSVRIFWCWRWMAWYWNVAVWKEIYKYIRYWTFGKFYQNHFLASFINNIFQEIRCLNNRNIRKNIFLFPENLEVDENLESDLLTKLVSILRSI